MVQLIVRVAMVQSAVEIIMMSTNVLKNGLDRSLIQFGTNYWTVSSPNVELLERALQLLNCIR